MKPTLVTSSDPSYLLKDLISEYILRYWGYGVQHMNLEGGDTMQPMDALVGPWIPGDIIALGSIILW